jgi:hypothetical protein
VPGILDADRATTREQDDRCLFFVAISRARDRLVLSRARRYGGRNAEPSPLLTLLESAFAAEPPVRLAWESRPAPTSGAPVLTEHTSPPRQSAPLPTGSAGVSPALVARAPQGDHVDETAESSRATTGSAGVSPASSGTEPAPSIDLHDLETYRACPRRYAYAHTDGLEGAIWSARHFHMVIRRALGTLQRTGRTAPDDIEAALQEAWSAPHEPLPHEALYVARARRAISAAVRRQAAQPATRATYTEYDLAYRLERPGGSIRLRLDRIDHVPDTPPVATIYRTGKQNEDHRRDLRTVLAHAALHTRHGSGTVRQEYVLTGVTDEKIGRPRTLTERLAEADAALQSIAEGRFEPRPSRSCPSCPFWLLCPGVGDHESDEE